jgi:hypothetical protein
MVELLARHKDRLCVPRYQADEVAFSNEIVPSMQSEAVQAFVAELSPLPPVSVPLRDDDYGLYGWPADGVRDKIRADGGSIRFGWRLREWPGVLLTAEFHAVWVDPDGTLVDITPAVTGDAPSLFVPDPAYPETFVFDHPPPPRYKVLHTEPDRSEEIARRIAQMKPTQRAYEERRAIKAGKTLEEWVLGKYPPDPLVHPIAAFVDACKAFDAKLANLPELIEKDPSTVAREIVAAAELAEIESAASDDVDAAPYADAPGQAVSGAPEPPADIKQDTPPAATHDDVPDAPVAAAGDATGDASESNDPDAEVENLWLPEYETERAEEELLDWADVRHARRRDILRLMPEVSSVASPFASIRQQLWHRRSGQT